MHAYISSIGWQFYCCKILCWWLYALAQLAGCFFFELAHKPNELARAAKRAEPKFNFQLGLVMSRAEPARYHNEPARAEPSRAKPAR